MKKKNLFWIFIPARSGSKSIKNKNIKLLNRIPLLAYSVISAKKLKIGRVVVSSDSKKYLNIAKKYGSDFLHLRPKKFSKDSSTDLDVFRGFLRDLKKMNITPPKFFIHLRPTTPIRENGILLKAIKLFLRNSKKNSSLRSVSVMSFPSYKTMRIKNRRLCSIIDDNFNIDKYNKPKEFFPRTYLPNGYIDIIKTTNILKNQFHGRKVLPYIDNFNSDIDSKEDYQYVKYVIERK